MNYEGEMPCLNNVKGVFKKRKLLKHTRIDVRMSSN